MAFTSFLTSANATVGLALMLAACASGGTTEEPTPSTASGGTHAASGHAGAGGGSTGGTTNAGGMGGSTGVGGLSFGGSGGGLISGMTLLYAHTGGELYQLDPMSLATTDIGAFDCIGGTGQDSSMTDIGVSASGDIWGISEKNVYQLVSSTTPGGPVHCAQTISLMTPKGVEFFALTFAPVGVLDPTKEVLVAGNTQGELWSVDPSSGASVLLGNFGNVPNDDGHGHTYKYAGNPWEISGDIVFLSNDGNPVGFATLRDCKGTTCNTTDTLVEVDLGALKAGNGASLTLAVRGQIVPGTSCSSATQPSDFGKMYGIAALGGDVYGFSNEGTIAVISNVDGTACAVASGGTLKWDGAGVTTAAKVVVPPIH